MTASGFGSSTTGGDTDVDPAPASPRPRRKLVIGVAVAAVAVLAAACGSSSSTSTTTTTLSPAAAAKKYLNQSGTGSKSLAAVTLPTKWTVTWTFNCQNPATTGTFALASSAKGVPLAYITSQTGLGGGGHKPYTKAGSYTLIVKTTCGWNVTVGSTPTVPVKSVATTTTTKPKKSTTTSTTAPKQSTTSTTSNKSTTPTT